MLLGGVDVFESVFQAGAHVLDEIGDAIAAEGVGGAGVMKHDAAAGAEGLEPGIDEEDD